MVTQAFDGCKLKLLRHKAFLTQAELAEKAGVATLTIVRLERGETPSIPTLRRIAEALDIQPAELAH